MHGARHKLCGFAFRGYLGCLHNRADNCRRLTDIHPYRPHSVSRTDSDRRPGSHDLHKLFRIIFQRRHFNLQSIDGQGYDLFKNHQRTPSDPPLHPGIHVSDRGIRCRSHIPVRPRDSRHDYGAGSRIFRIPFTLGILQRRLFQHRRRAIEPSASAFRPVGLSRCKFIDSRRRDRVPNPGEFQDGNRTPLQPVMAKAYTHRRPQKASPHLRPQYKDSACNHRIRHYSKHIAVPAIRI